VETVFAPSDSAITHELDREGGVAVGAYISPFATDFCSCKPFGESSSIIEKGGMELGWRMVG
jgi:hypothetical protein